MKRLPTGLPTNVLVHISFVASPMFSDAKTYCRIWAPRGDAFTSASLRRLRTRVGTL
jgi:hypothetical protein